MKTYYKMIDWFIALFYEPTLESVARRYAIRCHKSTNHKYDGKPYKVHLKMVVSYAVKYIYLIPKGKQNIAIASCWCHDTCEDTRQTYNNIKKVCGLEVADIVYAVTNEKGKNRKERANDKYYKGIRANELATFVKICDRLANADYSRIHSKKMYMNYWAENPSFKKELYCDKYKEMFDELDYILLEK